MLKPKQLINGLFGINMSNRKSLVMRGVAECVTEDELDNLLEDKKTPKAYVGFEPSGLSLIHI